MTTHGLVVVDKPAAWTSHDVVAKLRKIYRQRRVGHSGTLDPDATGVLLAGLGRPTRLLRFLQEAGKAYRAKIVFGVSTTTLDASGEVVDRRPMALDRADVEGAADGFVGEIDQLPPWCRRSRSTAAGSMSWRVAAKRWSARRAG
jgi:tRNA pseudouridine55 synthase